MRSNCVIQAARLWLQLHRAGRQPYLLIRPSRVRFAPCHLLVGELDPLTDQIRVASFKPLSGAKAPLCRDALLFEGQMVDGDRPDSPTTTERT